MAVRAPSASFAWLSWLLLAAGWVILLAGTSALQDSCNDSTTNSDAGFAGYLAPITQCNRFYSYTWWIVWYCFAMLIIVPIFLAAGWVHKWRMGLIGLLVPLVVLLQYTCDTFIGFWESPGTGGTQDSRAKALFVGSLLCAISVYTLIILFGVFDEKATEHA